MKLIFLNVFFSFMLFSCSFLDTLSSENNDKLTTSEVSQANEIKNLDGIWQVNKIKIKFKAHGEFLSSKICQKLLKYYFDEETILGKIWERNKRISIKNNKLLINEKKTGVNQIPFDIKDSKLIFDYKSNRKLKYILFMKGDFNYLFFNNNRMVINGNIILLNEDLIELAKLKKLNSILIYGLKQLGTKLHIKTETYLQNVG